jgi:hypothetical protein
LGSKKGTPITRRALYAAVIALSAIAGSLPLAGRALAAGMGDYDSHHKWMTRIGGFTTIRTGSLSIIPSGSAQMQLGATTAIGMITIIGTRDPGGLRMTAIGSSTITPSGTKAASPAGSSM